jgi:predicted enzyme related to lactoylglutathione lyase
MDNLHPTLGNGKICYVEIPALEINTSANFYKEVFGWKIRQRSDGSTAFDDTVNQVSGAFKLYRSPAAEVGLLIYIMVDDVENIIKVIIQNGGKIVTPVGLDLPEITARFSDPAGNVLGLYQQ